jgi:putative peptidoglycan lipid II flippase
MTTVESFEAKGGGDPASRSGREHLKTGLWLAVAQVAGLAMVVLQEVFLTRIFGARMEMDAYLQAWVLPVTLSSIIGGGIQSALIPHFVKRRAADGIKSAWEFATGALSASLGLFGAVTLVAFAGGPWIIRFLTAGEPLQTARLASQLYPLGFIFAGLNLLSSILGGICGASGTFVAPAILSNLANLWPVLFLWAFAGLVGIYALPMGLIFGIVVQTSVLGWLLWHLGLRLRWPNRTILRQIVPMAKDGLAVSLACGFMGAIGVGERHFSAGLGEGATSHLFYASKLMSAATRLLSTPLTVMGLPLLSSYWAMGNHAMFERALSTLLRVSAFLALATIAGMVIGSKPIIQVLFERGRFRPEDTLVVGATLRMYAPGLCYYLIFPTVSAGLLASGNAWYLPMTNLIGFACYLAMVFVAKAYGGLQVPILAAAFAIGVNAILGSAAWFLVHKGVATARIFLGAAGIGAAVASGVGAGLWGVDALLRRLGLAPILLVVTLTLAGILLCAVGATLIEPRLFRNLFAGKTKRPTHA